MEIFDDIIFWIERGIEGCVEWNCEAKESLKNESDREYWASFKIGIENNKKLIKQGKLAIKILENYELTYSKE